MQRQILQYGNSAASKSATSHRELNIVQHQKMYHEIVQNQIIQCQNKAKPHRTILK